MFVYVFDGVQQSQLEKKKNIQLSTASANDVSVLCMMGNLG